MSKIPDIAVFNAGSITIVSGGTPAGWSWLHEHLPSDAMRWGDGYVVEPRYLQDIINGAVDDGLEVEE